MSRTRAAELLLGLLALGVLAFASWGAELLYRRLRPLPELAGHSLGDLHIYSESYGWEPRPHFAGLLSGARTRINARGYRGPQHRFERRPGLPRLVLLGDSIAFGYGVHDEETFAALLERDFKVEVVNLAVEGWGSAQELLRLEREGLRYLPDVVVLNVCIENDVADNWLPAYLYESGFPQPFFRSEGEALVLHAEHLRLPTLRRLALALERHSLLFARLVRGAARAAPPREHVPWRARKAELLRDPGPALQHTFRLIVRMQALARSGGARLLVVLHPNKRALLGRPSHLQAFLEAEPLLGLERLDLSRPYRELGLPWDALLLDGSGHLTPRGHLLAARLLAERLQLEGVGTEGLRR